MVATRGPVVRGAEWLGQGESRRKTLPRTSAQSPRQLERVTLSPSFSLLLRPSISPSVSLHPPVPPVSPSCSSYLPSHARFVSSCPPSPSHLSTRTSPSPRRLLFLIPSPSRREIPSSSSPCPPLSRPPLIASFTFSQPLVEQAERADSDFRVLRRPRITSVLRRPINIALSLLPPSFHRLPRSLSLSFSSLSPRVRRFRLAAPLPDLDDRDERVSLLSAGSWKEARDSRGSRHVQRPRLLPSTPPRFASYRRCRYLRSHIFLATDRFEMNHDPRFGKDETSFMFVYLFILKYKYNISERLYCDSIVKRSIRFRLYFVIIPYG